MDEILKSLRTETTELNQYLLEYRIRVIDEPFSSDSSWTIAVVLSDEERTWREASEIWEPVSIIGLGTHKDRLLATKEALLQAIAWAKNTKKDEASILNPPSTFVPQDHTRRIIHEWSDMVPWYLDWRKTFKRRCQIEIEAYQRKGVNSHRWHVHVTHGNDTIRKMHAGYGVDTDLVEAFRQAGQQALDWYQAEHAAGRDSISIAQARGQRLLTIIQSSLHRLPSWMRCVRPATEKEQYQQVALVMDGSIGTISVKARSLKSDRPPFSYNPSCKHIARVLISEDMDDEAVLRGAIETLNALREAFGQALAEEET